MKYGVLLLAVLSLPFVAAISNHGVAQDAGVPKEGVLTATKTPIPGADELKSSQKKVREALATDFKQAKSPLAKWQLAEKLSQEAFEIKDDPDSEYAFATEAIELYVSVGDAMSAFRAVDELALTFDLQPIDTKVALFQRAVKEAKAVPLKRMMALVGLKLAGEAAAVEDYEAAKTVAALSVAAAKPSRDSGVVKRANEQQARFNDLLKQWQKVLEARQKLKSEPGDAQANDINGRYLCLVRQDWDTGLPLLTNGAENELKAVAKFDLATATEPKSQAGTAAAWWTFAEPKKGLEKQQLMARAAHWYEQALPGLTGLDKAEAENRLEQAYELISGRKFQKIMSGPANGFQYKGLVDCSEKCHPASMGKTFDIRRSWLVAFEFSPPHLAGGWHMVLFWGDGRIGYDPLWFRQDGHRLWCATEDTVNFRGQSIWTPLSPQQINKWIDIKFVHDAVTQELELYVNHRLYRKEALAITPQLDRPMGLAVGGTNDQTVQRFTGKVRNIWLGNIK